MSLYTGRGDRGETDLMGGSRVRKDHLRVEAMGAVDELNAVLGVAIAALPPGDAADRLARIQNDLFTLGAELALPPRGRPAKPFPPLGEERVAALEEALDALQAEIGRQRAFVLPGGSPGASALHVARAVARRVERRVVALDREEAVNPQILRYLNRLSSLLHGFALKANRDADVAERNPTY